MKKLNRAILLSCAFLANTAFAGPWLLPGNLAVKSDVDLLADAGLIKAPVMTWPIAWVNIGPELLSPETQKKLPTEPQSVQQAYQRIVTLYEKNYQLNKTQTALYAAGSNRLNPFRTFEYEPYAHFATGAFAAYQTKHFAGSLNLSYYHTPHQSYTTNAHPDNSYLYVLSENWAVGVDQFNRWWGPGYSDAMALSQNAEPFPALSVHRMQARAFKTKWLHWIGPWTVNSVAAMNGPSYYSNTVFWFTNIAFSPLRGLQFDISRNAIFGGNNPRTNQGDVLQYAFTGTWSGTYHHHQTNISAPGGEMVDIGTKWSLFPAFKIPLTLYQQTLFSDTGGNSKFVPLDCTTFLLGTTFTHGVTPGVLRTYFEYEYNIEHYLYWWGAQGNDGVPPNTYGSGEYPYTYYGNILSSSLGSEGIGYTLGFILNEQNGNSDSATIRYIQPNSLNRGTAGTLGYPFSKQNLIWTSLGRAITLPHHIGSLNGEIGYLASNNQTTGSLPSGVSVTFTWYKNF